MNRRKVRVVAKQPKTLEAIFKPERTGRNKNKKRNSHRRDGEQEGSICSKQVGEPGGRSAAANGMGRKHRERVATALHKYFKCLCCRRVGSVTFLLLALGHEFKSHIGFKPRADFSVTLPLSVQ